MAHFTTPLELWSDERCEALAHWLAGFMTMEDEFEWSEIWKEMEFRIAGSPELMAEDYGLPEDISSWFEVYSYTDGFTMGYFTWDGKYWDTEEFGIHERKRNCEAHGSTFEYGYQYDEDGTCIENLACGCRIVNHGQFLGDLTNA